MTIDFSKRTHWIFDMDGTLTLAVHDFPAIRNKLGINKDLDIIEAIEALPPEEAREKFRLLDEIEIGLTLRSQEQPGAEQLLTLLSEQNKMLGILTRNTVRNAKDTLDECNLKKFFPDQQILGRESAAPKPSPDGINILLNQWEVDPASAVMVGDYKYDLEAGRRAGTATIYVDVNEENLWSDFADLHVYHLNQIFDIIR
jgi:HAD superfamily hydrolase (TIGR01509 family)|tara:strand:+ start:251 stop:850 length:600 start_codon:yes stop_codon:yes gene_type:complete